MSATGRRGTGTTKKDDPDPDGMGQRGPFPDEKGNHQIITGGSAFTRAFRAYFTLKPEPLDKWIRDSKLENSSKQEDGSEVYEPSPGGDVGYLKIIIYRDLGLVIVYAYIS